MSILDTTLINRYEQIDKPTVIDDITLRKWFDAIKSSSKSNKIVLAREGKIDYDLTKKSLPTVTYNFLFKGYKKDKNIVQPTGLMYFDLDTPEFDLGNLDMNKIFSLNKSFGGRSYSILVRVDGLTKDNFNDTYKHISTELGIDCLFDNMAKKASQCTVLSYDPDIIINENCFIFQAINFTPSSIVLKREEQAYTVELGVKIPYTQLRFNNLKDYQFDCDYIVNWSGFTYIHCFIPFKNKNCNKYKTLLSYCTNLVWLNPNILYKRAYAILNKVNLYYESPSTQSNLKKMLDTVFSQLEDGKLSPIHDKPRKIIFDHTNKSKLSKDDKLGICRDELAKKKKDDSLKKLGKLIDEWDTSLQGKITQIKLIKGGRMGKTTVEKYYHIFKDCINLKNSKQ